MNFVLVCLHGLDMRDFHSQLRRTPALDRLRRRCIFLPTARAQGHSQMDSLTAELTGAFTAHCSDSRLEADGFRSATRFWLPRTVIEILKDAGYEILTAIDFNPSENQGTYAVPGGMVRYWLAEEPERLAQFASPEPMAFEKWLERIRGSQRFYAHIFLRETHRPWGQTKGLFALLGRRSAVWHRVRQLRGLPDWYPFDAYVARRAALEQPSAFAALRRRGLEAADAKVRRICEALADREDVTLLVYSNHGEVLDHFRYNQPYDDVLVQGLEMVEGTSHGPFPYEVLYASTQLWRIPGEEPRVMRGLARAVDIPATLLELAGRQERLLHGRSMLADFASGVLPHRARHAEHAEGCLSMVREDGLKLVCAAGTATRPAAFPAHRMAVFDLFSDPWESVDLADTTQGRGLIDWAVAEHAALK